jgi:hypothetical protein
MTDSPEQAALKAANRLLYAAEARLAAVAHLGANGRAEQEGALLQAEDAVRAARRAWEAVRGFK